jgi:hypothetical protein
MIDTYMRMTRKPREAGSSNNAFPFEKIRNELQRLRIAIENTNGFSVSAVPTLSPAYGATLNQWYTSPFTGTALSTAVLVVNTLYAMPFVVTKKRTIDQVAINVTAFVAGNVRVGLYSDAGGYPGALVAEFGSIAVASNGVKTLSASPLPVTLDPGVYWLAIVTDSASTIRGFAVASLIPVLGYASTLPTAASLGWSVAYTYAALPSTFPGSASVRTAAPLPAVFARFTS